MKLLLIGHTGSVGSAVLRKCLSDQTISSLVILARRPLSSVAITRDKRVRIIIVDNFTVYDVDVLQELEGAIGCLWYEFLYSHYKQGGFIEILLTHNAQVCGYIRTGGVW